MEDFNIELPELRLIKQIGEGASGEIFQGSWKGIQVAVKKVAKNVLEGEHFERFRAEIALLKRFRHPNSTSSSS